MKHYHFFNGINIAIVKLFIFCRAYWLVGDHSMEDLNIPRTFKRSRTFSQSVQTDEIMICSFYFQADIPLMSYDECTELEIYVVAYFFICNYVVPIWTWSFERICVNIIL